MCEVLLSVSFPRSLGAPGESAPLQFGSLDTHPPFPARRLFMAGEPAFDLSMWCGTCPFLFQRREGANSTLSAGAPMAEELGRGLRHIPDEVVSAYGDLLPQGEYLPLLLEVIPELVAPHEQRDYFTHEQVATWGVDSFWGLPENPRAFYYRTFETAVSAEAHLYEFVVPMVPPSWNDREQVRRYVDLLADGLTPTAVALSTLDVCQPADSRASADYYAHWGLTHFLLDGHHKMEAASVAGARVTLLALISIDGSLATRDDVMRLTKVRAQRPSVRKP